MKYLEKYLELMIVVFIWALICSNAMMHGSEMSPDAQVLSVAIISAGVLASK